MHTPDWLLRLWVRVWVLGQDDEGSHTFEYIVVGTVIAGAALIGATKFGDAIKTAFVNWGDKLK